MNVKMTHHLITLALALIPINLIGSFNLFENKITLNYYFMIWKKNKKGFALKNPGLIHCVSKTK